MPGLMDIHDLFHSSKDSIAKFAETQVHLYRHDVSLQNYFHALDAKCFMANPASQVTGAPINPFKAWSFRAADKASRDSQAAKDQNGYPLFSNSLLWPQDRNSIYCPNIARFGANRCRDSMFASLYMLPFTRKWNLN